MSFLLFASCLSRILLATISFCHMLNFVSKKEVFVFFFHNRSTSG
jgi:hypothetical protein